MQTATNGNGNTRAYRKVRTLPPVPFEDLTIALLVTEAYRFGQEQQVLFRAEESSAHQVRRAIRMHAIVQDARFSLTMMQRDHLIVIAHLAAGVPR